ncbi:MAG: alpha/beta fold hydrolase [Halobacteriaceae archaeon]
MDLPTGWTAESVHADGADLQCYRTGRGPALVMAHGSCDCGLRWYPLAERLADEHEVVTYDARGHGYSDAPQSGYAIRERVEDLRCVVDALELDDPVLLGHSMGAGTVGWAAASDPDLPRAAVLVEPMGMHEEPTADPDARAEDALEHAKQFVGQTVEQVVEADHADLDPAHARRIAAARLQCAPHALAALARRGYPGPLADVFHDVACPTLVLRADSDVTRRVRDLDAAEALQRGRLVHLPGAGHDVFRDAFEGASKELRTFLRRVDR